jgi:Leucine-rich repeat (LRR) protein
MRKSIIGLFIFGLIIQVLGQKLLVCQVSGNTCTFRDKALTKGEKVVIVADHGSSTTNADIKQVVFESSSIYSIPAELFTTFKNLEGLTMIKQGLQEIEQNTFINAQHLSVLRLDSNLLKVIDEDTFLGAHKLDYIQIDFNQIESVHKNAFKRLGHLKVLYITGNQISSFDQNSLENCHQLLNFSLHMNQLTFIHKKTFKNNLKITYVDLGKNKINALSNIMFSHLKYLDLLSLDANNCINIVHWSNAASQIVEIENSLRNCGKTYLSMENDEIMDYLQSSCCNNCASTFA